MTRKDYEAIAAAMKTARSYSQRGEPLTIHAANFNCGVSNAAQRIADHCAADNPRFDRQRFLKACGVA